MLFAGGEFYATRRWMLSERAPFPDIRDHTYFLNGGQACLMVIAGYLRERGIRNILLPAYLCPSIPKTLRQCGLSFDFYRIDRDFSTDLADLSRLLSADPTQAVYFINYFGFLPAPATLDFLRSLQLQGTPLVEDNCQAGFHSFPTGDFTFNSLRKFAPYDGAYLSSRVSLEAFLERYRGRINHRLPLIRQYRQRYARYLFENKGDHIEIERLYELAEQYYENDQVILGDPEEQAAIERLDWQGIRRVRRENYAYLLSQISTIPEVTPIFPQLQTENMPLGLPVYFSWVSRDRINESLGEARVGLTIHWEDMHPHPETPAQRLAMEMSSKILTLAIDQYASREQLDYQVEQLIQAVNAARLR